MGEILWTPCGESKADMDLKRGAQRAEVKDKFVSIHSALMEVEEDEMIKEKEMTVKWSVTQLQRGNRYRLMDGWMLSFQIIYSVASFVVALPC